MHKASSRNMRYKSQPGSIFEYEPDSQQEEEERANRKRARPANRRQYADDSKTDADDDDFNALMNYKTASDGNDRTAKNWMNYLQGEYKAVHPANHVSRERDCLDDATALVNLSKAQVDHAREAAVIAAREDEARMSQMTEMQTSQQQQSANQSRLNLQSYGYTTDYSEYETGYTVDETDAASCTEGDMSENDSLKANTFVAMYNFAPNEEDELNMDEGDMIDECQFIGEGWLYGYNRRTGEAGMLPANYVESVQL